MHVIANHQELSMNIYNNCVIHWTKMNKKYGLLYIYAVISPYDGK
jgi:hypothetical protein